MINLKNFRLVIFRTLNLSIFKMEENSIKLIDTPNLIDNHIRQDLFILPDKTGSLFHNRKNPDDKNETVPFKITTKTQISHDTFIFHFSLPVDQYLGINLGQHIAIDGLIPTDENPIGEPVSRKYTPISHVFHKGGFDLLIKVYYSDSNLNFPKGGIMSQWLDKLEIGSEILLRGPIGRMFYYGDGRFKLGTKEKPVTWREKTYKKVGMLCGGTGITPLYQILLAANINYDTIEYSMIYGNRTSRDILLKTELDEFKRAKNFKLDIQYTIDNEEEGWNGLTGYITKDKIEKYLSQPSEDTLIIICGRGKMCKKYLAPMLLEMGYKKENIYIF